MNSNRNFDNSTLHPPKKVRTFQDFQFTGFEVFHHLFNRFSLIFKFNSNYKFIKSIRIPPKMRFFFFTLSFNHSLARIWKVINHFVKFVHVTLCQWPLSFFSKINKSSNYQLNLSISWRLKQKTRVHSHSRVKNSIFYHNCMKFNWKLFLHRTKYNKKYISYTKKCISLKKHISIA